MVHQDEVLISGARVVDGSGNPWFYGDVLLSGDTIAEIAPAGRGARSAQTEVVDATGLVVCPGFIDIQSHSIVPFLSDRRSLSKITQGVTTEIMGEAWTPAPYGGCIADPFSEAWTFIPGDHTAWRDLAQSWTRFGDWLAWLEAQGVSVNVGSFVGGAPSASGARASHWATPRPTRSPPCGRCWRRRWKTAPSASPPP